MSVESGTQPLRRAIRLPGLVFYGMGTTIGAGVYALMGEVAGAAGLHAPIAFVVAAAVAALTAGSFAELSTRFPRAGGEAVYVREGLGSDGLARLVGLLVALAGIASAATVCRAFAATVLELAALPFVPTAIAAVLAMGGVAAWGIRQSVGTAAAMTVLEIGGLVLVASFATDAWTSLPSRWTELIPREPLAWSGVAGAAILAFYAFLGFEDMVNVVEEVRDPHRTLPWAIGITLLATTGLYLATAVASVLTIPPDELARSSAPLALVFERSGGSRFVLGWIALIAMLNGALIQIVKASRVLYGLADLEVIPRFFARVHPVTHTPVRTTAIATLLVAIFAVAFPLDTLAAHASLIAFATFSLSNLALIRIHREGTLSGAFRVPRWVPWLGLLLTLGLPGFELAGLPPRAGSTIS